MFKKALLILSAAFALTSCNNNTGADGYVFGEPQYVKTDLKVEVVLHPSQEALVEVAKEYGVTDPNVMAFSLINPKTNVCKVHIVNPAVDYVPEFIGHEFTHCVYGQWHTDNASRR